MEVNDKGALCRAIAGKCALAAREDVYSEERSSAYGQSLKDSVLKRLRSKNRNMVDEEGNNLYERVQNKLSKQRKSVVLPPKDAEKPHYTRRPSADQDGKKRKKFYEPTEASKRRYTDTKPQSRDFKKQRKQ